MKKLLTILTFFVLTISVKATNYFITSIGNNSNTGTGQTAGTAWQTSAAITSHTFSAGDSIFFHATETFYGGFTIPSSGSSGNVIYIGKYGIGANPIITGLSSVTSWVNTSGNIWQSTTSVTNSTTLNMVVINGNFQPMGRWPKLSAPNGGYYTYQSHTGNTSITSNQIASIQNFVGGEVVVRCQHWILDRERVNAQTTTTIGYTNIVSPGGFYNPTDGFGFFFQNHVNACTQQGDWVYDSTSRKLSIYSIGSPTGAQVSTVDTLVRISSKNYITFQNLIFTGSNSHTFDFSAATHIIIDNCNFSFAGINVIDVDGNHSLTTNCSLTNCTATYTNNNFINVNNSTSWVFQNNTIKYTAINAGMGLGGDEQYFGMTYVGNNSTVSNNEFDSVGYTGIFFTGTSINIQNNYVHHFCLVKDDGGGIYSYSNNDTLSVVNGNIVLYAIGAPNGTSNNANYAEGIYMDDRTRNLTVINNTVANGGDRGIYVHNSHELNISNNTSYNNATTQVDFTHDGISPTDSLRNITFKDNILCSTTFPQLTMRFTTPDNDVARSFTVSDSNYYARPINQDSVIRIYPTASIGTYYTLAGWQSYSGLDAHSKGSPKIVTDTGQIKFYYNATGSVGSPINLPAQYIDMPGNVYSIVVLQPYSSIVLVYDAPLPPPSGSTIYYLKTKRKHIYRD